MTRSSQYKTKLGSLPTSSQLIPRTDAANSSTSLTNSIRSCAPQRHLHRWSRSQPAASLAREARSRPTRQIQASKSLDTESNPAEDQEDTASDSDEEDPSSNLRRTPQQRALITLSLEAQNTRCSCVSTILSITRLHNVLFAFLPSLHLRTAAA